MSSRRSQKEDEASPTLIAPSTTPCDFELEDASRMEFDADEGLSALLFGDAEEPESRHHHHHHHQTERKFRLNDLPFDICVALLLLLPPPSAARLAASCRVWRSTAAAVASAAFRHHAAARFRIPRADLQLHQRRLDHDPGESSWPAFYRRLDAGVAAWRGIAIDPVTSAPAAFPYAIDVLLQDARSSVISGILASAVAAEAAGTAALSRTRITELSGHCRFRSLNDALTRIEATIVDDAAYYSPSSASSSPSSIDYNKNIEESPNASTPNFEDVLYTYNSSCSTAYLRNIPSRFHLDPVHAATNVHILRPIVFEERQIVRGANLAIPNRYYGMLNGFIMLGMFDPGHPALFGVFCVVAEDAMPMGDVAMHARDASAASSRSGGADSPSTTTMATHAPINNDASLAASTASATSDAALFADAIRSGHDMQGYLTIATNPYEPRAIYACRARVIGPATHLDSPSTAQPTSASTATSDLVSVVRVDMWILTVPLVNSCTLWLPNNNTNQGATTSSNTLDTPHAHTQIPTESSQWADPLPIPGAFTPSHAPSSDTDPSRHSNTTTSASSSASSGPWAHISIHGILDGSRDTNIDKLILFSDAEIRMVSHAVANPPPIMTCPPQPPSPSRSPTSTSLHHHDNPPSSSDPVRDQWIARHIPVGPIRIYMQGSVWISTFVDPSIGVFCLF